MNQRWVLDYALGYQTFGGLPWTSFFWPRLHTYPPLQWGLEGRQLYLYRLGLKNRVSILESTWGSFSRKTYGYWVLKQKTKNRCPLQPSLTNFIFLSRVMTLILQYLKLMVTERRQIPWSPRERDKRWRGPRVGNMKRWGVVEGSNLHVDRPVSNPASLFLRHLIFTSIPVQSLPHCRAYYQEHFCHLE